MATKIATAEMRANETVHIAATIENAAVNSHIGGAAPFSALAVLFAHRTATVRCTFFGRKKLSLGHSVLSARVAAWRGMTESVAKWRCRGNVLYFRGAA